MTATAPARIAPSTDEQFAEAYRQYSALVMRIIRGIVRYHPNEWEDIAQRAWLLAFTRRDQFDGRSSYSTWVSKIAINESLTYLRQLKTKRTYCESDVPETDGPWGFTSVPDPSRSHAAVFEDADLVALLLPRITSKFREVIQLEYFNDEPPMEAAALLGIIEDQILMDDEANLLAWNDGFRSGQRPRKDGPLDSLTEMFGFWKPTHGLDSTFHGQIIYWDYSKRTVAK